MLKQRFVFLSLIIFSFNPRPAFSQFSEKVVFNNKDSANDYYLAVRPLSGNIQAVQILPLLNVSTRFYSMWSLTIPRIHPDSFWEDLYMQEIRHYVTQNYVMKTHRGFRFFRKRYLRSTAPLIS